MRRALAIAALGAALLPQAAQADDRAVNLKISPARVVFGERVELRGTISPAAANILIFFERGGEVVTRTRTDADGRFTAGLLPARGGVWRARIAGTPLRSAPVELEVAPRIELEAKPGVAFAGTPVIVRVKPHARVRLTLLRGSQVISERSTAPGPLVLPTPGVGRFVLRAEAGGASVKTQLFASARTLSYGSTGTDVEALRRRLGELRIHVPAPSGLFGGELYDAVVAFQKSRGLDRTGVVDEVTWRELGREAVPRPRYGGPAEHIEISKSRQILLVVRGGETVAVLPVSSGAGGITPAGSFAIKWKALATTTWLGPAILYRTMTFNGNVAIHGYGSVPTYPASHGCVRIPIWAADWLYQRSHVGERVYVYEE